MFRINSIFFCIFLASSSVFIPARGEAFFGSFFDSYYDYDNLKEAIENDRVENVKRLIEKNDFDTQEISIALHQAIKKGNIEIVQILIDNQADLDFKFNKNTPFHLACSISNNSLEIATALIDAGCNTKDLVYIAASAGNFEVFKMLFERGFSIDKIDATGATTLHYATFYGNPKMLCFILENSDLPVDIKTNNGITPFMAASTFDRFSSKFKMKTASNYDRLISRGCMMLLLEKGADINATDTSNRTALFGAVSKNYEASVAFLLDSGADVDLADINGFTPLMVAVCSGNSSLVKDLVQKGATVNLETKVEFSPPFTLHSDHPIIKTVEKEMAAKQPNHDKIKIGPVIKITMPAGSTALSMAQFVKHEEIVKILLEAQ